MKKLIVVGFLLFSGCHPPYCGNGNVVCKVGDFCNGEDCVPSCPNTPVANECFGDSGYCMTGWVCAQDDRCHLPCFADACGNGCPTAASLR